MTTETDMGFIRAARQSSRQMAFIVPRLALLDKYFCSGDTLAHLL